MGGYGSGRRVSAQLTTECLTLDMSGFLKKGYLTGEKLTTGGNLFYTAYPSKRFPRRWAGPTKEGEMQERYSLSFLIERYATTEEPGTFHQLDASGHLTLMYTVKQGDLEPSLEHQEIPLVVTHPYMGGVRWWYLAPCCGRRVRVLYLSVKGLPCLPRCRQCLDLNYASQRQSFIERHKTYERHLLANYGWAWAEMEYLGLKEHYLEITPEIEYTRQCSILQMRMRMLRLLMSSTRLMLRTHMYNLRSIKSEEDRRVYLEFLSKEHGQSYALDLVRMLGIGCQMERQARQSSSEVFDQAYKQLTDAIAQSLQSD